MTFNSAVEPSIILTKREDNKHLIDKCFKNKIYKIKCFPNTGNTQIPGILMDNLADGKYVAQCWLKCLQENLGSNLYIKEQRISL